MNRIQQHKHDVNTHLGSMIRIKALPPAFRHYGDYRTGILQARKNGFTNREIAIEIHKQTGKGPLQRKRDGTMGLNIETGAVYVSAVVNHHKVSE